eukprot:CAMPEP_0174887104 /NCGR_PEP_ID=MMETSP0167-20121228/2334_1 /TAXON_ID=38298 /ORGANISM="Rhodella maculata, Strain CCMP736" /LENGTH=59 /DNA_ID=CAMNT_0016123419 /DNA_START=430 /DNA_END=606 /DNA_ORIENTATION=+
MVLGALPVAHVEVPQRGTGLRHADGVGGVDDEDDAVGGAGVEAPGLTDEHGAADVEEVP